MRQILLILGTIIIMGFVMFGLMMLGVYLITSGLGIPFSPKYVWTVVGVYLLLMLTNFRVKIND